MGMYFFKYHGAGNDFILIDDRHGKFPADDEELIKGLCARHTGIGSDGLLLIQESKDADVHLEFFNPDASQSFCGNGSRCGLAFARKLGMVGQHCTFTAIDGLHQAKFIEDEIEISMGDVSMIANIEGRTFVHTGSPHVVIGISDVEDVDVKEEGSAIRYSDVFWLEGVNVNFVQALKKGHIAIRTYERGVEDETLACGTGVTAAALVHADLHQMDKAEVKVEALGGTLHVSFERDGEGFKNIWLRGPAIAVYGGEYSL